MKIHIPPQRRPRVEMLPLIDIVFLLLVFFIYAMFSMAVHRGVTVTLPTSQTAGVERDRILSVSLRADGRIFVDRLPVLLENLKGHLAALDDQTTDAGVLLFADQGVSYQKVFQVLDQIQAAGISRVSLQAKTAQEDGS